MVIAASRDRLKNLQHRGIAPSWSRKPPQTHQDFRLKRFGLRARLSAPAQDKTITPQTPRSQWASRLEDLKHLDADGVIVGKALYEGRFSVAEALEVTTC